MPLLLSEVVRMQTGQTPVAKILSGCIVLVVLSKYCALLACDRENSEAG